MFENVRNVWKKTTVTHFRVVIAKPEAGDDNFFQHFSKEPCRGLFRVPQMPPAPLCGQEQCHHSNCVSAISPPLKQGSSGWGLTMPGLKLLLYGDFCKGFHWHLRASERMVEGLSKAPWTWWFWSTSPVKSKMKAIPLFSYFKPPPDPHFSTWEGSASVQCASRHNDKIVWRKMSWNIVWSPVGCVLFLHISRSQDVIQRNGLIQNNCQGWAIVSFS